MITALVIVSAVAFFELACIVGLIEGWKITYQQLKDRADPVYPIDLVTWEEVRRDHNG